MSSRVEPDSARASRTTATMARKCSREASSGTTPPYLPCVVVWEATTEESTVSPFSTTAAAVSSQEDSMPRIRMCFCGSRGTGADQGVCPSNYSNRGLRPYENHGGALHARHPIKEIADFRKFRGWGHRVTELDSFFQYEFAVLHTPLGRQSSVRALEVLGRWNFIGL